MMHDDINASADIADAIARRIADTPDKLRLHPVVEMGLPEVCCFDDVHFHNFTIRAHGVTLAFIMDTDRIVWVHDVGHAPAVALTCETDVEAMVARLTRRLSGQD
jgi:hypothetical protein